MKHRNLICLTLLFGLVLPLSAQAQNMSNADRQKLIANVTEADGNDDGAISRKEFETLIKLNAGDGLGRATQVQKSGRYGLVFNRLDSNGDGFLTQQEMQQMAQ